MTSDKQVNADLDYASFVAKTRKKLNLSQRVAAEVFGVGASAFSRYETGRALPSLPLRHLLKILDAHTEFLYEIRERKNAEIP